MLWVYWRIYPAARLEHTKSVTKLNEEMLKATMFVKILSHPGQVIWTWSWQPDIFQKRRLLSS